MALGRVTHVIFDLDGTLLDTEGDYESAFKTLAKQYGKEFKPEYLVQLKGRQGNDNRQILVDLVGLPISPDEVKESLKPLLREKLYDSEFMPGAERLVNHLFAHGIPIAIATSSSPEEMKQKTERADKKMIFDKFCHVVCGGGDPEVKKGKPEPDIFLICASRFCDKPEPKNVLVFEDSVAGKKAALAAGMFCVMTPSPDLDKTFTEDATQVLQSLCDFKPEDFCLPPFEE